MNLSRRDYEAVLRILPELYSCRRPDDFFRDSIRLLKELLTFDLCAWNIFEFGRVARLTTLVESEPRSTANIVQLIEEGILTHPFPAYWTKSGTPTALMLSDFPRRVCEAHRWSVEPVYRHLEMGDNLALPVASSPGVAVGWALSVRSANSSGSAIGFC